MMVEVYTYTCRKKKVKLTQEERSVEVKYVRGHATILCSECCNVPVSHLVYRDWEDHEESQC